MIKIITRLFKKPENKLLNQLNEIDELKQTVESSYAREDMMRDKYTILKTKSNIATKSCRPRKSII